MAEQRRIAAIDMGSNAIRLAIAEVKKNNFEILTRVRVPIRLGAEAFGPKESFSKETIEKTITAAHQFAHLMEEHNVDEYKAFATSAFRDAKNSHLLAEGIKNKTGLKIERMSGDKEAQYILRSILASYDLTDDRDYVLCDLGGGSFELSHIKKGKILGSQSFDWGTVRLMKYMDKVGHDKKEIETVLKRMQEDVLTFLNKNLKEAKSCNLIGTGGNFRRFLKVRNSIFAKQKNYLKTNELGYIKKVLEGLTYEQRMEDFSLRADRADVIIPALKIVDSLVEVIPTKKIYAPNVGLVNGILLSLAGTMEH